MTPKLLNNTFFICVIAQWIIFGIFSSVFPGMTLGNGVGLLFLSATAVAVSLHLPYTSSGTTITISCVSLLLGVGVILNTWFYTIHLGGTPDRPVLINPDCHRWWNDALFIIDSSQGIKAGFTYGFYGYVLAGFLWVFGQTVGSALLFSMTLILMAVLLTGFLTFRLTGNKKTSLLSVICVSAVCYWLAMGTLILKDAFIIVALLVGGLALTYDNKKMFFSLVFLSCIMLMVSRPSYIVMLIGGLLIAKQSCQNWRNTIIAAMVCCAFFILNIVIGHIADVYNILNHQTGTGYSYSAPQQMALYNMVGNYPELPFYKKLLYLPLSTVVQFFIPFFWTWERDIPFGLTEAWAHVGFPWYFFGFVLIYFLAVNLRNYKSEIYRFTLWGILCWLVPCFLFAGTVSRYGLPFVALLGPAVAMTIRKNKRKKSFYISGGVFCLLVCMVLIVAYHLQNSAMQ